MKTNPLPIIPLIQQHATDAAFYWQHIHDSLLSATMEKDDVIGFTTLLNAHLDGLLAAGETGWNEALNNLETWLMDGEAFVCGALAFKSGNVEYINTLLEVIERSPESMSHGFAEAAKYVSHSTLSPYLDDWLISENVLLQQVAICGCAAHNILISDKTIRNALISENTDVKTAICRYLGQMQLTQYLSELHMMFGDKSLAVREAAALAICWIKPYSPVLFHQLFSVLKDYLIQPKESGTEGLIIQQKVANLTRMLGQVLPYDDPRLKECLNELPDYLEILFLAHHGDSRTLFRLRELLKVKELSSLAFWAIAMIVGIDIDDETFLILDDERKDESEKESLSSEDGSDDDDDDIDSLIENLDASLIPPNIEAVEAYLSANPFPGRQLLFGKAISVEHCRFLLENHDIPLIIQHCSLWHLFRLEPKTRFKDLRFC